MNSCYICGISLESYIDSRTKNHFEHIIPQALGGQLTIKGILCKECGGDKYLGGKIDKPFCDIFSLITQRIDLKNDRKTKPISLEGKYNILGTNECIDIYLRDNIISNKIPDRKFDHNNKIAYIYANNKVAKHYKIKVENELKKLVSNYSDYTFKIISSLNEFMGILELPFNLENSVFEKGLTKIAIEFALSKGIKYETIKHLIDREKRTIKCKNNVTPYFPIAKIEEMIEYTRTNIDANFISHSLVLFSQRFINQYGKEVKQLYCFVELFGTFQYFVELSDNFIGKNIEPDTYSQRIIKLKDSNFKIKGLDYKDLFIVAEELDVNNNELKELTYDEVCIKLQNAYDKKNKYIFDYRENTERLLNSIIRNVIPKSDNTLTRTSIIREIKPHFYNEKNGFHITFFRTRFMKGDNPYSVIPAVKELYVKDRDKLTRYTHFKFNELNNYLDKNKNA